MEIPDPQDFEAFQRWCIQEVLNLLNANTGPSPVVTQDGYGILDAAEELIERHPELVEPMVDHIPLTVNPFGWDMSGKDIAIEMIKQIVHDDPEVMRIDRSREQPHWQPST